jgi:ubiquinone/menaquinone biosynthesis C-methylase UbiE
MPEPNVLQQMRSDWNDRALEDAYYYVAFGRREQEDEEFFATAADVVRALEIELKRLPAGDHRSRRALEIGCGPGRLMRPMSWNFGEIHGCDVSDEMIRLAAVKLEAVPNAYLMHSDGRSLTGYEDNYFDYVYSYAVFQHIPSREVVFSYLSEARRVLKPGGIVRFQINGLPRAAKTYNTWEGVRISAREIAEFALDNDFQLLALEGVETQYMWVTFRKQPAGFLQSLAENPPRAAARIRRVLNAHTAEAAIPARGRYAFLSLLMENMPEDCDLNQINVEVEGEQAAPVYIGPETTGGVRQVNALLPPVRTGLLPVDIYWFGEPLCESSWARVVPAGPVVPRLLSVTDGVNLLSGPMVTSRMVKLVFEELSVPERVSVTLDGAAISEVEIFCADPVNERFELNFRLPGEAEQGPHEVGVRIGTRAFPPAVIDVRA